MPTTSEQDGQSDQELLDQTQAYLEYRSQGHDPPLPLAAAWNRFYDCYAQRLRAVLARWDLTAAEREDCFQEVWVAVVARLCQFRPDPGRACVLTWLTTVARNKATDVLRHRRPFECLVEGNEDALLDTSRDPAAECDRRMIQVRVRTVLAGLSRQVSATSYQVLYLRWMEGRSIPEIADALELTPEQVRFRHHRMKQKFRDLFEQTIDQGIGEENLVQLCKKKRNGSARNKFVDFTSNK